MDDKTLIDMLERASAAHGPAIALRTPQRGWTFGEVRADALRVASGLRAAGVGPGDRVACLTKHGAPCTLLALGSALIGAVCTPVNWRLAAPEIEYIVDHAGAKFMMVDGTFAPMVRAAKLPSVSSTIATDAAEGLVEFERWVARFEPAQTVHAARPADTALQLYSSGTTGLPKGVEISHANLIAAFDGLEPGIAFHAGAVMFNALPMFHISGIGVSLFSISRGGTVVFQPEFVPERVLHAFEHDRVTHTFLVPAMILALLNSPSVRATDFRSLEVISYGASPISERVLVDALATFGCRFVQVYGLTETSGAVVWLPPEDHDPGGPKAHLLRAAGRAGEGVGLRIVDAASGRDLPDGEVGEVWIRSPQNMIGYWANPKATAAAYPEGRPGGVGWFRSGDAGYLRDGYLYIHDRIKDMVISGGENIYPAEVENALMRHPAIADCAVIGVPDPKWGEAVKAIAVLRDGMRADEAGVIAWMRERLAHYKCPKSVDFVDALPRNPSGKLLKFVLRKPYWEGRERQVN